MVLDVSFCIFSQWHAATFSFVDNNAVHVAFPVRKSNTNCLDHGQLFSDACHRINHNICDQSNVKLNNLWLDRPDCSANGRDQLSGNAQHSSKLNLSTNGNIRLCNFSVGIENPGAYSHHEFSSCAYHRTANGLHRRAHINTYVISFISQNFGACNSGRFSTVIYHRFAHDLCNLCDVKTDDNGFFTWNLIGYKNKQLRSCAYSHQQFSFGIRRTAKRDFCVIDQCITNIIQKVTYSLWSNIDSRSGQDNQPPTIRHGQCIAGDNPKPRLDIISFATTFRYRRANGVDIWHGLGNESYTLWQVQLDADNDPSTKFYIRPTVTPADESATVANNTSRTVWHDHCIACCNTGSGLHNRSFDVQDNQCSSCVNPRARLDNTTHATCHNCSFARIDSGAGRCNTTLAITIRCEYFVDSPIVRQDDYSSFNIDERPRFGNKSSITRHDQCEGKFHT